MPWSFYGPREIGPTRESRTAKMRAGTYRTCRKCRGRGMVPRSRMGCGYCRGTGMRAV